MFNTLQRDLGVKLAEITDEANLRNTVYDTVSAMVDFVEYFQNLGMNY